MAGTHVAVLASEIRARLPNESALNLATVACGVTWCKLGSVNPGTVQVAMLCNRCRTLLVSLSLSVVATVAVPWTPQAYPQPTKDVDICRISGQASWICDPDRILHSAQIVEDSIEAILQARNPYHPPLCPGLPNDTPGFQVGSSAWVLHFGMLPLLTSKLFPLRLLSLW